MNSDDQFEKRLRRQRVREIPSAWRGDILRTARATSASGQVASIKRGTFITILGDQISTLLWPHPRAWAGLAAAWLVIIAVNLASHENSAPLVKGPSQPPSEQMREMLREQQQMLAELFDPPVPIGRPKAVVPRPQSYHRNEFLNA